MLANGILISVMLPVARPIVRMLGAVIARRSDVGDGGRVDLRGGRGV